MGRVKRRLAAGIGPVLACQFQRQNLACLVRRLKGGGRWRLSLAVTPDAARAGGWGLPGDCPRLGQGRGDLGQRMGRVMAQMEPGPVVIIGSDIPGIQRSHIAEAFRALGSNTSVFGPSADGGYWLVGLRRRPRLVDIFLGVRWSGPHALRDTMANLDPGDEPVMLEVLEDIDEPGAYWKWRREIIFRSTGA